MKLCSILSPQKEADIFKRDIFVAFCWVLAFDPFLVPLSVNLHHMVMAIAHEECMFRGNFPESLGRV
jgi:hypothetical protein